MREAPLICGPFTLHERLGGGGQGQVWKGVRSATGELRAIKLIPLDNSDEVNAEMRSRAQRESSSIGKLRDPRIVRIYETGQESTLDPLSPSRLWLEYEFVDGCNVAAAALKQPPSVGEALALLAELGDALQLIHDNGVVHRDIKPENVMLRGMVWHRPVVVDFGCASVQGATNWTRTIHNVGTRDYMAPEVVRSARNASAASDQFSLAVLGCDLLLTARAGDWSGQERKEMFQRVLEPTFPNLAACLRRARSRRPEERFVSMQAFREALLSSAVEDGAISPPVARSPDESALANQLRDLGFEVVDKRLSGGALWVVGREEEFASVAASFGERGVQWQFAPDGGKATGHRPGWYTKQLAVTPHWAAAGGSKVPAACLLPMNVSTPTVDALMSELMEAPKWEVLRELERVDLRFKSSSLAVVSFKDSGPLAREWAKAQPGSTVYFSNHGLLFGKATLALKLNAPALAKLQWPDGGEAEPLLMFLADFRPCDIPVATLAEKLGFSDNFRVRALMALGREQAHVIEPGPDIGPLPF